MLESVSTGVTTFITWIGEVLTSITTSTGALYPLLVFIGLGVGLFVIRSAISIIKDMIQGY